MNHRETWFEVLFVLSMSYVLRLAPAVQTCEHQFPFVKQTPVRNEVLQGDSLQEMFEILKEKQPIR